MSSASGFAVELKGVTFKRGERSIFDDIDIRIPRGQVTAIMGPSGCGKTTLLRLISAQLMPAAGDVVVAGKSLPRLSRGELFDLRKQMGVLFQSGALFTDLDVFENVAFPLRVHTDLPEDMIRDIVLMKLEAVGLRGAVELMPDELSGGMKRRVMIAKALSHEPTVLFLDEPTAGVDVELRRDMWAMVRRLRERGVTIILTTHYIEEAEEMADRIGVIRQGEIILVEDKARLMKQLGKKQLILQLPQPMRAIPAELADTPLELADEGHALVFTFDTQRDNTGIAELLRRLEALGIDYRDLQTRESSLEDIFVDLVRNR